MMNFLKNKLIFFCVLSLYTVLFTAVLLYYRFPADTFKLYCESFLEQMLPESTCSIKNLQYRFPFGLTAKKILFSSTEKKPRELFFINQAKLQGTPLAITSRFHVDIYAGDGSHSLNLVRNKQKQNFILEDISINNLNLEKTPFLHHIMKRTLTGSLQMKGRYQGELKGGKYQGDGQGSFTIDNGSLGLLYPILSLKEIDFQKMESDIVLDKNDLKFANGTFNGNELTGIFSGNLEIQPSLALSTLSFRGEIEPLAPLLEKSKYAQNMIIQLKKQRKRSSLPFLLKGTIQKPKFHFDS